LRIRDGKKGGKSARTPKKNRSSGVKCSPKREVDAIAAEERGEGVEGLLGESKGLKKLKPLQTEYYRGGVV